MMGGVISKTRLAGWFVANRAQIDQSMSARLGPAAPQAGAEETEVLRRFRSFVTSALRRGDAAKPALDGLRPNERRVDALLSAWSDAATELAGDAGENVREALNPLLERFRMSLRSTGAARRKRGAPRSGRRRVVMAAIDRVADAFIAIDSDTGTVVDANPAAGALLGVPRDALLEVDAMSFVPEEDKAAWWTELDAMTEASEPRRFRGRLQDARGGPITVDCTVTRFASRGRVLALVLARPAPIA